MTHLYVCHFSNGHIKVGRSVDPKVRIASHADRIACVGIELVQHHVVACVASSQAAEAQLIERCAAIASKRNRSEWFEGLEFGVVCEIANVCAELPEPVKQIVMPSRANADVERTREWLASCRYQCRWRDDGGRQAHYWVDTTPDLPHWPDSAVMRWDLRQSDWHQIWPELIDHPCAYLFAPTHPNRTGPPKFRDWARSWPAGFVPSRDAPELDLRIRRGFARGTFTAEDLRPSDWHRIWPELITHPGAPQVPTPEATNA